MPPKKTIDQDRLDKLVADSHRQASERERGYREQALKMYPWICGRCSREFNRDNLQELTVHHRDHNHDNNPADGSNWELLCIYCHDNEHQRYIDAVTGKEESATASATHQPFAGLKDLLKKGE